MTDKKVDIYIEIEQFSNIKYEYDKHKQALIVDRILHKPFKYPYAYGFIVNTLADDNDELDVLIITDIDKHLKNDTCYSAYIIGALYMEDEKGIDEKVLCVLEEYYKHIKDIKDLSDEIKNNISVFFDNYKKNVDGKWSRVGDFINKQDTIQLYEKYKL